MGPPDPAQKGVLNRPLWRPYLGPYLGGPKGAKSRVWPSGPWMLLSHNGSPGRPKIGSWEPYFGGIPNTPILGVPRIWDPYSLGSRYMGYMGCTRDTPIWGIPSTANGV